MPSITVTRVNGKGRRTGDASLAVDRDGEAVYVKLGMTRALVSLSRWRELIAPTLDDAGRRDQLTWKDRPYTEAGMAGGIELFTITWHTQRNTPNWLMRTTLPGVYDGGPEYRHDDKDTLKARAEDVLAAWLAKVNGQQK